MFGIMRTGLFCPRYEWTKAKAGVDVSPVAIPDMKFADAGATMQASRSAICEAVPVKAVVTGCALAQESDVSVMNWLPPWVSNG
tara:strand:+ start:966 stop:1217 length:252 start_codon:yes stop_codon:yes gene_type:complete